MAKITIKNISIASHPFQTPFGGMWQAPATVWEGTLEVTTSDTPDDGVAPSAIFTPAVATALKDRGPF